jgi:hypothetical protein
MSIYYRGRRGCDRMVKLDLQLPVQSVHITTKVVSLNPVHGEVYLIQINYRAKNSVLKLPVINRFGLVYGV